MMPRRIVPRANRPRGFSTVTPGVSSYSGKIVDVEPSVMQRAALLHELRELMQAFEPMPPRMSSRLIQAPRFGVASVFL